MSLKIQELSFSLSAGVEKEHKTGVPFTSFLLEDCSSDIEVSLDGSTWFTMHKAKAISLPSARFKRFKLRSASAQTVKVQFGDFDAKSNQAAVNATINTTIEPSNTFSNPADKTVSSTALLLAAANTSRKELIINVPSDAVNAIRVGGATVTASAGLKVEPGSTITLASDAAVYAIRDGASDVTVTLLEMSRP